MSRGTRLGQSFEAGAGIDYCRIEFPDHCVERWPFADTARSQAILDSEVLSREFGDGWLRGRVVGKPGYLKFLADGKGSGPVLAVPSVVVRQEWNYPDQPQLSPVLENSVVISIEIQD